MKKTLTYLTEFTVIIFNLFKDGIGNILLGVGMIIAIIVIVGIMFSLGAPIVIGIIALIKNILHGVTDPYVYLKIIGVTLFFLIFAICLFKN